jgi:hypothetical protein
MIDRFSKWQRTGAKNSAKAPLEVKWRSSHAGSLRDVHDNAAQLEAARDTIIFRWTMLGIVITLVAVYVMFFMNPAGPQ